jgi:type IV fimbrial biogenesis protein FimT
MNSHKGFNLIELMIVVAIIGVLTSVAVPAFANMMQRNRLKAALESFKSDMQWARIQAIKRSQSIIVSRTAGDLGQWCYGFTQKIPDTKTSCDCMQSDASANDYCEIKRILGTEFNTINQMLAVSKNSTINFRRGTVKANGITFSSQDYAARVMFSDTGRVRICTPDAMPTNTQALPSVPDCN